MKNKLLSGTMRLAIIAGSLMLAGGNTNAQPKESVSFDFAQLTISRSTGNRVEILISTPDIKEFLSNPVSALRRQGVAVPQAAEAHWRAFTVALRRLGAAHVARAKESRKWPKEHFHYSFDKIEVVGTIAGDGNGNGTVTTAAGNASARFLDDPLATLRAERVEVPAADEPAWRQMADALKELQGFYSRIKTMRNAEGTPGVRFR